MINGARFAKSRVCRVRQVRSSGARRPGDATKMLEAGARYNCTLPSSECCWPVHAWCWHISFFKTGFKSDSYVKLPDVSNIGQTKQNWISSLEDQ